MAALEERREYDPLNDDVLNRRRPTVAPFLQEGEARNPTSTYLEVAGAPDKPGTKRFVDMGTGPTDRPDDFFTNDPNSGLTREQVFRAGHGVGDVGGIDTGSLGRRSVMAPEQYGQNPLTYTGRQIAPARLRGSPDDWANPAPPVRPKNPTQQVNVNSPAGPRAPSTGTASPGGLRREFAERRAKGLFEPETAENDTGPGALLTAAGVTATAGGAGYKLAKEFDRTSGIFRDTPPTGNPKAQLRKGYTGAELAKQHQSAVDAAKMGEVKSGAATPFDDVGQRADDLKRKANLTKTDPYQRGAVPKALGLDKAAAKVSEILGKGKDGIEAGGKTVHDFVAKTIKAGGNPVAIAHAAKIKQMVTGSFALGGKGMNLVGGALTAAKATKVGGLLARGTMGRGIPLPYGTDEAFMKIADQVWSTSDSGDMMLPAASSSTGEHRNNVTKYGGKAKVGETIKFSEAKSIGESWRGASAIIRESPSGEKFAQRMTPVTLEELKRAKHFTSKESLGSSIYYERFKQDINRSDFDLDDSSDPLTANLVRTMSNYSKALENFSKDGHSAEDYEAAKKEVLKDIYNEMHKQTNNGGEAGLFEAARNRGVANEKAARERWDKMEWYEKFNPLGEDNPELRPSLKDLHHPYIRKPTHALSVS